MWRFSRREGRFWHLISLLLCQILQNVSFGDRMDFRRCCVLHTLKKRLPVLSRHNGIRKFNCAQNFLNLLKDRGDTSGMLKGSISLWGSSWVCFKNELTHWSTQKLCWYNIFDRFSRSCCHLIFRDDSFCHFNDLGFRVDW